MYNIFSRFVLVNFNDMFSPDRQTFYKSVRGECRVLTRRIEPCNLKISQQNFFNFYVVYFNYVVRYIRLRFTQPNTHHERGVAYFL